MKMSYDPAVDAAYLRFSSRAVAASEEIRSDVIFDHDAENRIALDGIIPASG